MWVFCGKLIFRLTVKYMDPSGNQHQRRGKLNLVDLAGSERHGKTGIRYRNYFFKINWFAELGTFYFICSNDSGLAFTESKSINLSLSTLGKVIQVCNRDCFWEAIACSVSQNIKK